MSNLVKHAQKELALLGEEEVTVAGYLRIVRAFAAMGHSGGSASVAIPVITKLLCFEPLTPLTNNADEWIHHGGDVWGNPGGEGIWQNRRDGRAFSCDDGKTYWLVTDKKRRIFGRKTYKSVRSAPPA